MKLSRSLTTVTPFSKFLASTLFVLLPLGTFYLGVKMNPPTESSPQTANIIEVKKEDTYRDMIKRCGDIPSDALRIEQGHFTVIDGPEWAPDCRHLAWSSWESGTSLQIDETTPTPRMKPFDHVGVYLYKESSQKIEKIYTPVKVYESPVFIKWLDRQRMLYKVDSVEYIYDISTKKSVLSPDRLEK